MALAEYLTALAATRASVIQLREKDWDEAQVRQAARLGVKAARAASKLFLVNTHAAIALEEEADGVHLTSRQSLSHALALREESSRADFAVGKSVHSVVEAVEAERQGADYVMLGPVFDPLSKNVEHPPLGLSALREAVQMLHIPVAGVGGVAEEVLDQVWSTGAIAAGISWAGREIRFGSRRKNS